jgi:hypothetical protein
MTKPNSLMINKLLSIITERERVYQTATGGRAQGGMDPVVEEERDPDGGS